MAGRLAGKTAVVVGAGSIGPGWGNGKATAVLFAREPSCHPQVSCPAVICASGPAVRIQSGSRGSVLKILPSVLLGRDGTRTSSFGRLSNLGTVRASWKDPAQDRPYGPAYTGLI